MKQRSGPLLGQGTLASLGVLVIASVCLGPACGGRGEARETTPSWLTGDRPSPQTVAVDDMVFETPPPPFQGDDEIAADEIYPCSGCHEPDDYDPTRRELTIAHQSIVLRHDEEHRWCLDCHDAENRDRLHLANGTLVQFEESYRLCGQCHGDKYRDWRAGVHGRRSGSWDGEKQYLLCVHCHNSHDPRFKPLAPLPPPLSPKEIR